MSDYKSRKDSADVIEVQPHRSSLNTGDHSDSTQNEEFRKAKASGNSQVSNTDDSDDNEDDGQHYFWKPAQEDHRLNVSEDARQAAF
jgi:hypothetical protein